MARTKPVVEDDGPDLDPAWVGGIRETLPAWFDTVARDLPWRATRDPYAILVSEIMLIQTTVAAVIPFYHRFLQRFPTAVSLAEADEADVLKAWEGLGYYRRARQLHEAAKRIASLHGGTIPDEVEAVANLPGVGRYIQGAVLSFAFDRRAPILEANTQRVMARWLAWDRDLKDKATQDRLWRAAGRVVPEVEPGKFNQAFMELGALICTPRQPSCLVCPVESLCLAKKSGKQDGIPVVAPRAAALEVEESCVLIANPALDRLLVFERGPGRLWERFWEFPTLHRTGADPAGRRFDDDPELDDALQRLTGLSLPAGPTIKTLSYGVTKHKVALDVHAAVCPHPPETPVAPPGFTRATWASLADLRQLTLSAVSRRILDWLEKEGISKALGVDQSRPLG